MSAGAAALRGFDDQPVLNEREWSLTNGKNKVYWKVKHYCESAACEHRVMITDSINHCQPQLILSYLFLFCSIQVSRNIWQPSSLGRAKDQTVLLFIDSKAPPAQPQSLLVPAACRQLQLQPGAAVLHFGAFWRLEREVSLLLALWNWGELCLIHRVLKLP